MVSRCDSEQFAALKAGLSYTDGALSRSSHSLGAFSPTRVARDGAAAYITAVPRAPFSPSSRFYTRYSERLSLRCLEPRFFFFSFLFYELGRGQEFGM